MQNRILIIDDDADITSTLKTGLELHGFSVGTFNDPRQAISMFRADQYDMAILDIQIPGMNGFDVYRRLRKVQPDLRIAFLTAFEIHTDEFRRLFPDSDVNLFLTKPITVLELARIIRRELAGRRKKGR
jgi:DNA-binding response OmpR family regulator